MEATTALEPPHIHEAAQTTVPAPKAAHNQTPANAQVTMHAPSEAIQPNQVDPNHSMRRRSGTNAVTTPAVWSYRVYRAYGPYWTSSRSTRSLRLQYTYIPSTTS